MKNVKRGSIRLCCETIVFFLFLGTWRLGDNKLYSIHYSKFKMINLFYRVSFILVFTYFSFEFDSYNIIVRVWIMFTWLVWNFSFYVYVSEDSHCTYCIGRSGVNSVMKGLVEKITAYTFQWISCPFIISMIIRDEWLIFHLEIEVLVVPWSLMNWIKVISCIY